MLSAAIPADEAERIESLQALEILDTPPEERFDRVTRLAKRIFGVPIVAVSLIDTNRQWFKSCIGLDVTESPRETSFCGHAIHSDTIYLVTDAQADPRFHDNPLVQGDPHIRFYAGCPLGIGPGSRIGTLCLIDREPRSFSEDDAAALRDLAGMVEQELVAIRMATLDELTQLSNRRGLLALGQNTISLARRFNKSALMFFVDLDGFKPINDKFGHAAGDQALKDFAQLLIESFREADVIARPGGDEFVVLCADCPESEATGMIARLRGNVERHNREAARGYDIRFSVGAVAYDPSRHHAIADLVAEADALMYQRKQHRR